jgi:hypothetical protein
MLTAVYRRGFLPLALICVGALVGVDILLVTRPQAMLHRAPAVASGIVALACAVALVVQRRRQTSRATLAVAVLGLLTTSMLWGSLSRGPASTLAVVAGVALFCTAVLATLVRAEAAETPSSTID